MINTMYYRQTTHQFINEIIRAGTGRSLETSCILGRALADVCELTAPDTEEQAFSYVSEESNRRLGQVLDVLPVDIDMVLQKAESYYKNRMAVAYPKVQIITSEANRYWQVGGISDISAKEHAMWDKPSTQHAYNDFRKLLDEVGEENNG